MDFNGHEQRKYTVTIKPASRYVKGDLQSLKNAVYDFSCFCSGDVDHVEYEKLNTHRVHAHLLLTCPYITNKASFKKFFGDYHIHTKIISKKCDEQQILDIWLNYIKKEKSTSKQYYEIYGNMFIDSDPEEERPVKTLC